MNVEKVFFSFIATLAVAFFVCTVIQSCRLGNARQQLSEIRAELNNAENRQRQLAEITSRTGSLLSESVDTVAGIRRQITEIRKNYEEMESLLNSSRLDKCGNDSISDTEVKE